jgi:phage tail P2-like protein
MDNNVLASAIKGVPHLDAFDELAKARMDALDLEKILVYIVDTVDASALPFLAAQFDVLGYKGWFLTTNDDERRALIKRAIELHRYKGTPWSVKEAIRSIGFLDVTIIEGVGFEYDGSRVHDGSFVHGGGNWANFRVIIDLGESKGSNAQLTTDLIALIDEYKSARATLVDVSFITSLEEFIFIKDKDELRVLGSTEYVNEFFRNYSYNGTFNHDGSRQHGASAEQFELVARNSIFEDNFGTASDTLGILVINVTNPVTNDAFDYDFDLDFL